MDTSWDVKAKDEARFPTFSLINKATGKALRHGCAKNEKVTFGPYHPDDLNEVVLFTQSADVGVEAIACFLLSALLKINKIHNTYGHHHHEHQMPPQATYRGQHVGTILQGTVMRVLQFDVCGERIWFGGVAPLHRLLKKEGSTLSICHSYKISVGRREEWEEKMEQGATGGLEGEGGGGLGGEVHADGDTCAGFGDLLGRDPHAGGDLRTGKDPHARAGECGKGARAGGDPRTGPRGERGVTRVASESHASDERNRELLGEQHPVYQLILMPV
eukprot:Gb_22442 [translate_table: standard]